MRAVKLVILAALVLASTVRPARAGVFTSPADDLLLAGTGYSIGVGFGGTPDHLNDGNEDGNYGAGSISHSDAPRAGNYMGVMLPGDVTINTVVLYNRTDCCSDRIDGNHTVPFTLDIYNSMGTLAYTHNYLFSQDIFKTGGGDTASGMTINVGTVVGNDVRIIQNNNDWMNIAELEAYGSTTVATPEPATLALLGMGALGMTIARMRSRK